MADVVFSNTSLADTNLKDISQANITDATATGYTFTGAIGSTFAIDAADPIVAIADGECTVQGTGAPTYATIKTTGGSLGLYLNPQL